MDGEPAQSIPYKRSFMGRMNAKEELKAVSEKIKCEITVTFLVVYDNFKFLTRAEVESLGLSHLIGTDALRAEMHGYFMDMKFYLQVIVTGLNMCEICPTP